MSDLDDQIRTLFAADAPPALAPAFTAGIVRRIARRRLRVELAMLGMLSVLGALLLWPAWPAIAPTIIELAQTLAPAAAILALVLTLAEPHVERQRA